MTAKWRPVRTFHRRLLADSGPLATGPSSPELLAQIPRRLRVRISTGSLSVFLRLDPDLRESTRTAEFRGAI